MRRHRCAALVALAFLGAVAPASAQSPSVQGLLLGVSADVVHSDADQLGRATAYGVGGLIGHSVGPHIIGLFGVGIGTGANGELGYANIAMRAYPPMLGRFALFGEASFMSHGRSLDDDELALGTGFSFGAGTEYFFRPHRSIVVSVHRWNGGFDEVAFQQNDIDIEAEHVRLSLGLQLRPPRTVR